MAVIEPASQKGRSRIKWDLTSSTFCDPLVYMDLEVLTIESKLLFTLYYFHLCKISNNSSVEPVAAFVTEGCLALKAIELARFSNKQMSFNPSPAK